MNHSSTPPLIEVHQVSRTFRSTEKGAGLKESLKLLWSPKYKTVEALKNISFSIEPGAFVGLIGANGAGKTTLLKILSGLIPPTTGNAQVLGFQPFERPLAFRQQIALVMGQKAQLWWDLPALDAFDLLRAIYGIPLPAYRERLTLLTELLDVTRQLKTQIRRLSLGERMKMELIGAILHWPKVIFLDEPTIGLDVLAAHKLREFLKTFNHKEKSTILLTSHNMDDIERLCSRVLILRSGELIYDGSPQGLMSEGLRRLRVRFMNPPTREELSKVTGIPISSISFQSQSENKSNEELISTEESPHHFGFYFTLNNNQIVPTLQSLLQHCQIVDMGIEEQSLESVIQRLYEDERVALKPV